MTETSRPRDTDRKTRIHLSFYDRVKFLLFFLLVFVVLTWAQLADNPLLNLHDAAIDGLQRRWWLLALFGIETIRQLHFLGAEILAPYHGLWQRYFAAVDRTIHRLSDWNRFRLSRVIKALVLLILLSVVLGAIYKETPIRALFLAPKALWSALPLLGQLLFGVFFVVIQFVAMFWFLSRGGIDTYFPDDIRTRFSDVWGQDHVLNRIRENLLFLESPEEIEKHGGYVPGGILLWGPPGTGKTLMAESMAGETGKPFVFVDPGAFNNMFFGVGVLKVKSLFRKLRKLALRYGGVVVFFDEADSLGNRGISSSGGRFSPANSIFATPCHGGNYLSDPSVQLVVQGNLAQEKFVANSAMGGGNSGMGTLQALLTELSGLKKPKGFFNRIVRRTLGLRPKNPPKYRILVVMATNMPEALDEALLRPGRIDRMYRVGYPSKAGRVRTYEGYLAKVSHSLTPEEIDKLATITPYSTGATIKDTINEALIMAIRHGRQSITWADVIRAKQLKELGPAEDVEYIERERHAIAIHEACHGVMAYLVRHHMSIDLATIEKGSDYLGMVASIPPDDQFTRWRTEYEADILVSLASLAGERMFFEGDNSSGVSGDLETATTIASFMEGHWGMGVTVSSHASNRQFEVGSPGGGGRPKEDGVTELRRALSDRIEDNLSGLLTRAEEILTSNRAKVLSLAHALEIHKTMSGEDVIAVMEGAVGPLVDGRPYSSSENIAAIESYHSAAVRAHNAHEKPDLTIPIFTTSPA
ncbi:MAG: AAA family ATPase [Actinomycetes bacterium]